MIRNYFKTAWRGAIRRKFYSILNVSGLALAIACSMLIYIYINFHLSFDTYHKRAGNIFQLVYELHLSKTEYDRGASVAMLNAMKAQMPEVRQTALSLTKQSVIVDVDGDPKRRFKEEGNTSFTNADWFNMFSYHWIAGDASQLDEPNTVVLTQKLALKYFGNEDPIDKILSIKGVQLKVAGLIGDAPFNTDMHADMYISIKSLMTIVPGFEKSYFSSFGYLVSKTNAFVILNSADEKDAIERKMLAINKGDMGPDANKYYTFKLLPLGDIHFDAQYDGPVQKSMLITLALIAALIMLIAGINYVNMTIALQAVRSVEIGTRKVLGGSTVQLFFQLMVESFIISLIAVAMAGFVVLFALPAVNHLLFADNPVHVGTYQQLGLFLTAVLLLITVGTGVYPALLMSRAKVFNALKNNALNLSAGLGRKVLIVLQNVVAQVLIVCTIIMVTQVSFLKDTDKGFNRKMVVTIPVGQVSEARQQELTQALKSIPQVVSFTLCHKPPSSDSQIGATVQFDNRTTWETWPARFAIGDSAYCRTFSLQLIAGRNIRNKQTKPEFLINEKMAAMLSCKKNSDIIGHDLSAGDSKGVIVGIVKDFNVRSLMEPIEPSVVLEDKYWQTNMAIKLSGQQLPFTLNAIKESYRRILPDQVFSYRFVDDEIAQLYKTQTLQQKLIWGAATVALFISSLGLLGLVSLVTLQRTKEIGIRKVLGATVSQVNLLLSKDFFKLVILSLVIASPVAWLAMHKWLQSFAYRIEIKWWFFALAALASVCIAGITISFQSIKAALANPVKSLRSE